MAIEIKNKDEENKDKGALNASGQPLTGAAPESSGQGTAAATGPSGANSGTAAPGNRFVNIQRYLQANQGAGSKLGGAIGQQVGKAADKVGQDVAAGGAVQSQLDAEKDRIAKASGFAQQIQQDPTKIANDQNQFNAFNQLRTGQTGLSQIGQQAEQVGNAAQSSLAGLQTLAGQTGTEAGRFDLLRQALGRPTYTRGQQKLDQLLLQGEGNNALGQLQQQAQMQATTGQKNVTDLQNVLGQRLTDTDAAAKAAAEQLTGALGRMDDPTTAANEAAGAMGGFQTDLQKRSQDFINSQQGAYNSLMGNLDKSSGLSPAFTRQQLQMLGLNPDQELYDVNLKEYINPSWNAANVTPQAMANAQDLAKYQALSKLAGSDGTYLTDKMMNPVAGMTVDPAKLSQLQQTLKDRGARVEDLRGQMAKYDDGSLYEQLRQAHYNAGNTARFDWSGGTAARLAAERANLQKLLEDYRPGRMVGVIE